MTTREQATSFGDKTIVVRHTFDAPRQSVWEWWTQAEKLAQWFAPEPLTVPISEADVSPGGTYRLVMRDEEGNDFESTGTYEEVVEPKRLVYTDSVEAMPQSWVDMVNEARGARPGSKVPDGVVSVAFEETDSTTRVTFTERFDSKETRDAYVEMQMVEGLEGSFENLERLLAEAPVMSRR